MKKFFLSIALVVAMLESLTPNVFASDMSWYCKRESNHKTVTFPKEYAFISECGGYSYDKKHTNYNDAEKVIYLTFDAGYENGNVEKILNILNEENVVAAFFVLGNLVEHNTELVVRMVNEGHLVCNHTFSHKNMSNASRETLLAELKKLEDSYRERTGCEMPKIYRPPEGRFSRDNLEALKEAGYSTVFWSFAYADWDNEKQPNKEQALKKLKENLHNGEIMLLHPTSSTNVAILSEFISFAKNEGFRFSALTELIGE